MADTAPSSATVPATPGPDGFLETYRREHATTRKVLRAFPPEQAQLKPHERSSSAMQLAWTFVVEMDVMLRAARHEPVLTGGGMAPPPATWAEMLEAFDARHEELVSVLEQGGDAVWDGTVDFFTGPGQMGRYSTANFLWYFLFDQIHHRGQLSVYLRMAGGRVPAIYGPSADEPWR